MNGLNIESASAQGEKVLIVDDEPLVLDVLQAAVATTGVECVKAASVDEALSILKKEEENVFLVFLDWRLREPRRERSGAEFLQAARELNPLLPVIVMTGMPVGVYDVESDALLAEADGFFDKPFRAAVVQGYVKRWLRRRKAAQKALLPENEGDVRPLEQIERLYVRRTVEVLSGNNSLAAERLGISRHTVAKLLKEQT